MAIKEVKLLEFLTLILFTKYFTFTGIIKLLHISITSKNIIPNTFISRQKIVKKYLKIRKPKRQKKILYKKEIQKPKKSPKCKKDLSFLHNLLGTILFAF